MMETASARASAYNKKRMEKQTDRQTDRHRRGRASNKYSLGHHPPIFSVQPTYFITEKKLTHTHTYTHMYTTCNAHHYVWVSFMLLHIHGWEEGAQSAFTRTPISYTLIVWTTHPVTSRGIFSLFFITKLAYMFFGLVRLVHYLELWGMNMNIKRRVRTSADRTTH